MKIILYTYEATKSKKTGIENHALQLIKTLQLDHMLEAIIQLDRRLPVYNNPKYLIPTFLLLRRVIHNLKIFVTAFKSIFLNREEQVRNAVFYRVDVLNDKFKYPLGPIYENFSKLHISKCIYDTIRFNYVLDKRAALIEVPKIDGANIFWLTAPFPMYMKDTFNVCTIHDTFVDSSNLMVKDGENTRQRKLEQVLNKFDLILPVSDYTRGQLLTLYPQIDPSKIRVVYQALPEKARYLPHPTEQNNFLQKLGVSSKGYLLHVGSLLPRKNQKNIIRAYINSGSNLPLIMVGKKSCGLDEELSKLIKQNHPKVIWLKYIADEKLNILYHNASALIFVSLFEGFGIPILEAFYHQCPVLTSNTSAIPEVAGDAVLYVDPHSIADISQGIEKITNDRLLQKKLIKAGNQQLLKFSDEAISDQINNALRYLVL